MGALVFQDEHRYPRRTPYSRDGVDIARPETERGPDEWDDGMVFGEFPWVGDQWYLTGWDGPHEADATMPGQA
jgi:hypothetical protein